MIDLSLLISTTLQGYNWLHVWHEKQNQPPYLPDNAVMLFKRFKEAYETHNITQLGSTISEFYQGDIYGVSSKKEFLNAQKQVFNNLPWGISLCLSINVYSIIETNQDIFSAIIDTHTISTLLRIPLGTFDSAPIRCEIRPEDGLWVITKMFIERRLISN